MFAQAGTRMSATYLNALGMICALGAGKAAVAEALFAGDPRGLRAGSRCWTIRSTPWG